MDEKIRRILTAALQAPSGDNIQPWEFKVSEENTIEVFLTKEGSESIYDYKRKASFFSTGAVLENIVIAARCEGWYGEMELFPEPGDSSFVARVRFSPAEPNTKIEEQYRQLCDSIFKRVANRKKYTLKSVTEEEQKHLQSIPQVLSIPATIHMVEDPKQIKQLAKSFSYANGLVFKVRRMHDNLYKYLVWSQKEMDENRSGLYVKTLEMSWFDRMGMWFLRPWVAVKLAGLLGTPYIIAKRREGVYAHTGAYCTITMHSDSIEDFVKGGRIFQRIWLEATVLGLYMHPQFSLVLFEQLVKGKEARLFSETEFNTMKERVRQVRQIFSLAPNGENTMIHFRLGRAPKPSTISKRKPVEWVLREKDQ